MHRLNVSLHVGGPDHGAALLAADPSLVLPVRLLMLLDHVSEGGAVAADVAGEPHAHVDLGLVISPCDVAVEHEVAMAALEAAGLLDFQPRLRGVEPHFLLDLLDNAGHHMLAELSQLNLIINYSQE